MNTPNAMNCKGYAARVEFDAEDGLFVGHLAGIDDVIGLHPIQSQPWCRPFVRRLYSLGTTYRLWHKRLSDTRLGGGVRWIIQATL